MKMRLSFPACVLAVVLAAATGAFGPAARAEESQPSVAVISMDQAVKMAEQRFNARVVRAETQQSGGNTIYVLRLLNDAGRAWIVRVDASNGAVL
jgi:uncharacterized membrane protein YkoI